jgi:hypothetical protein
MAKKDFEINGATHIRVFNPRLQLIGPVLQLQWSLFALRVGLLCTSPAFDSDCHFPEITEMLPVVLGFSRRRPLTLCIAMRRITAPSLYQALVNYSFEYKEHRLVMVYYEDAFLPAMPDGAHKGSFLLILPHLETRIKLMLFSQPKISKRARRRF